MLSFKQRAAKVVKQRQQQEKRSLQPDETVSVVEEQLRDESPQQEAYYGEDQVVSSGERPVWERALPLERIDPNPFQPRQIFDETKLQELAAGMREHGWVGGGLPVRPHPTVSNRYQLIWGERRWRAALIAELSTIPCVISDYSDDEAIELGLLENIQRENLTKLEEGQAYVQLLTLKDGVKPRYSIRKLAQKIGKDKSYIEDRLLYARVPMNLQQLVIDQPDLSPRIIRELAELLKHIKPEEQQPIIESVREGGLRIEDVNALRKKVEQQERSALSESPLPFDQQRRVSVATDTHSPQEGSDPDPSPATLKTPEPSATPSHVLIFDRTLQRESEAFDRLLHRLDQGLSSLSGEQRALLEQRLVRWRNAIDALLRSMQ